VRAYRWRFDNGERLPISASMKQKLKTRSSTKSELVGVDDMMPIIIWTCYFLLSQGYGIVENLLLQVQSFWSETGVPQVANVRGTLISGTSLFVPWLT